MADIPDGVKRHSNEVFEKLKVRSEAYVKTAMELRKRGPGPELAEPLTKPSEFSWWPLYPWWNIFLYGPYQKDFASDIIDDPPYRPSKIVIYGEPVYYTVFIWRNPAGINWIPGPSACQYLAGKQYQINLEVVNLTKVTDGPDKHLGKEEVLRFPTVGECFQHFEIMLEDFPRPEEGKPDLYHLYATIDIKEPTEEPFAGFATFIYQPDVEPLWWSIPNILPHVLQDQPSQFMVYRRRIA